MATAEFSRFTGILSAALQQQHLLGFEGFLCGSAGKESACNMGDPGLIPELGRSLEKGKATHSSILAYRIPWTVKSMGSKRVGHN